MKRPQDAHKKYTYPVPTMIIIRPVQGGLVYSMGKSRRRGASRNGAASRRLSQELIELCLVSMRVGMGNIRRITLHVVYRR